MLTANGPLPYGPLRAKLSQHRYDSDEERYYKAPSFMAELNLTRGSEWHRWDPHIHTPATLFNNQFKGDWDGFIGAVEQGLPQVEALGVTDYCVLDGYKEFRQRWEAGGAKNVRFMFPNVEF